MDMAKCPFNARHEVPRVELRYHTSRCPDRAMLEADFVYGTISVTQAGLSMHITLHVSFRRDTKHLWSLLPGVYARESKTSHSVNV